MRVFYITRARLSFSRAHTRNIVKTAEHLSLAGFPTTVFSSAYEPVSKKDIFDSKGIRYHFALDVVPRKRSMYYPVCIRRRSYDVLYFRDPSLWHVAFFARFVLRKKIIFEVHGSHEWPLWKFIWHFAIIPAHGLVFITHALKEYYSSEKPSIVVHANGTTFLKANVILRNIRQELCIPSSAKIIMYAGSFLWDSIEILFSIIKKLSPEIVVALVGIREDQVEKTHIKAKDMHIAERVFIIPRIPTKDVPVYLVEADILINTVEIQYPGSISSKLYEYLSAGKPIITSPGGANREVIIDGENGMVADPPTEDNFVIAIQKILKDSLLAKNLSENAKESSKRYTWKARGDAIAEFMKNTL